MSFRARRQTLHRSLGSDDGVILWLGSTLQARNYPANPYMPFRQDSHFLYYVGLNAPDFAALSYPDGTEVLFGHPVDMDTIVWEGPQPSLEERAQQAEMNQWKDIQELPAVLKSLEKVLYLPPYQASAILKWSEWFDCSPSACREGASKALVEAVVQQRLVKTDDEVAEIESALNFTADLFHAAMARTRPDAPYSKLLGYLTGEIRSKLWDFSFPPILTHNGETLHIHDYDGAMEAGRLVLLDMGVETSLGYASDITRSWPVTGTFSPEQRDIYNIVLQSQLDAIDAIKPGVPYRDVHLVAARTIAEGLTSLGLMKGDPKAAVEAGAHALFFPHGVGHMLGGDVHDMEDLGDAVGYLPGEPRSTQFGLNFLRLARPLQEGHVVTVEPGIYFIPALFEQWRSSGQHEQFLNYDAIAPYMSFGGIRIEDDVLVTSEGQRVLGPGIAKTVEDVEARMKG